MADTKLLVLDEPTEGLAPVLVEMLREAFQSLNRDGMTILLVEQQVETALAVSGRNYLMENGAVVHEGTPAELLSDRSILIRYLRVDV